MALLGHMDATVSRGLLVVKPVVALIHSDFEPVFTEDEVQACFRAPLESFLDPVDYSGEPQIWNSAPWTFHKFQRSGQVITGMTALLLVRLAELVYQREFVPGVGSTREDDVKMITHLLETGRIQWREGTTRPDYLMVKL